MKLSITTGDETRVSTASAIDLAGSEDNRRTGNNRERLVESASINKSLFVLAQCVEAISKKASRIPYRESRMTRILSLGQNNGLTIMILNLAPVRSYHLDTLSSLNFANRTKKIEVREVENEPVFKGCARPVPSFMGPTIQRQPLRPLATTTHNATVRGIESSDKHEKPSGKPAKAFSVYADKSRSSGHAKRSSPLKRSSGEAFSSNTSRPMKIARPTPAPMSKATIEDMVEKKVTELLAARALDQPTAPQKELSDEMKQRLERLEKKIEDKDSERSEGLNFMLMAKQHYLREEYSSALRMFELSREYFPDNLKLEAKIAHVRRKIQDKKAALLTVENSHVSKPVSALDKFGSVTKFSVQSLHSSRPAKQQQHHDAGDDSDYHDEYVQPADDDDYNDGSDDEYVSDTAARRKPAPGKAKKPRAKQLAALAVRDENAVQTPRTKQLLQIINSRDVAQIRLLKGVGAKKADAIVEALCAAEDEVVGTLGQLGRLKGVGAKTVENMRVGLTMAAVEYDF